MHRIISARHGPLRTRHPAALVLAALALAAPVCSAAQALSLAETVRVAEREAPQLLAQRASLQAAEQMVAPAGELPDPKLAFGVDNLPINGEDRFSLTRDFMTMRKVGVMQDIPGVGKRRLRTERAEAEARKEAAMLEVAEVNLRRDVALAWFDVYFAERQLEQLEALTRESELQITAAQAALAGGKAPATEPFAARLADAQLSDRLIVARQVLAKGRSSLARWIGPLADSPLAAPPDFERLNVHHGDLLHSVDQHPHLAMYGPMQAMAEAEVRLAQAAKHPDWSVELMYSQRGSTYSNMVSVGVTIDLPIFEQRRQDPAIAAKLALAEQTRAQAEDARRAHVAEIRASIADWEAAKERAKRYEATLVPLARERTQAALAAYRGGKADLMPLIDARKGEVETRIGGLQAQNDLARAWAQLNFLYPDQKGRP